MSEELEIFTYNSTSPESAWLHGGVSGRGWLTGSLRADDALDISAEFDTRLAGQVGVDVARALASLDADASVAAHAGLRMQVGTPLDLFTGAGLVARVRMEASISAEVQVTGTLSLGALRQLVMEAVPQQLRRYAEIMLEAATISGGVWARGTFAAMLVNEVAVTVSLFPTDDSPPGISAFFRYGYSWGYGGGWGTVVNFGFKPDRLLQHLSEELAKDLVTAIRRYREASLLQPSDPLYSLTEAAEIVLPEILTIMLDIGHRSMTQGGANRRALQAECGAALRRLLRKALASQLVSVCADLLQVLDVDALDDDRLRTLWAQTNVALAALGNEDRFSADDLVEGALLISQNSSLLPEGVRSSVVSAVRCAVALVLVAEPDAKVNRTRLGILLGRPPGGLGASEMAAAVLVDEFEEVAQQLPVVPRWVTTLVGSVGDLVPTLMNNRSRSMAEYAAMFGRLITDFTSDFLQSDAGRTIISDLPPDAASSLSAAAATLSGFCSELGGSGRPNLQEFREGLTACVLTFLSDPVTRVLTTVADRGLRQAPPAFRRLASEFDNESVPVSISSDWEQLGRASLGVALGLPTANLLRRTADKVENWCNIVLPEELAFVTGSIKLHKVCNEIVENGLHDAIVTHRNEFRGAFAAHCVNHVANTMAFTIVDSAGLLPDVVAHVVESARRSLALTAVAVFKAFEESVVFAEGLADELDSRRRDLERTISRETGRFSRELSSIARRISELKNQLGRDVTDWLIDKVIVDAAATGLSRDVLTAVVTGVMNGLSGGLNDAVSTAAARLADALLTLSGSLLQAAEDGPAVGVRGLASKYWTAGNMQTINVPITIEVPHPLLPFILPSLRIEVGRVTVPGQLIGDVAINLLMFSLGVGPLLDGLDPIVDGIRLTRVSLDQVKSWIEGSQADEQRASLEASRAGGPLSVEVVSPLPNASPGPFGEISFLVHGANASFIDPTETGLPSTLAARVSVTVNGRDVTHSVARWEEAGPSVLRGRVPFSTRGGSQRERVAFVRGPVVVMVLAVDGEDQRQAHACWQFVPETLLSKTLVIACQKRDSADPGRAIDAFGGTTSNGARWRLTLEEALALRSQGTQFVVQRAAGDFVEVQRVFGSSGWPYLRTPPGRGAPRLGDLPSCPP